MNATTLDALATALQSIFESLNDPAPAVTPERRAKFEKEVRRVLQARVAISDALQEERERVRA